MRVCHFCEISVEGAYFKNLAEGLIEKGIQVSFVELGAHKPPSWLADAPEAKYFSLGITNKLLYPLAVLRLAKLIKHEKFDILQTHLYYGGLIGVLAKRLHPKTIVMLTRHHTSVVRMLGKKYHIVLDKWMAERADCVIAVSEAVKKYMETVDRIRGNHIEVIYYGFDFDKLTADESLRQKIRDEFHFSEKNFVIGYVANFPPGKGHIQLVTAFNKIAKEIPEARLFLVGRGRLAEVDDAIEKFSLQDKVVFSGWRDNVSECLNAMDLFVQPSLSEAFSQVLVEAMGAGLPMIATEVGGASEVITNGKNGFLIPPNDTEAIFQKTLQLYRQPELRKQMALAGKKSVRESFTIKRMINRQFEVYERLLSEKK